MIEVTRKRTRSLRGENLNTIFCLYLKNHLIGRFVLRNFVPPGVKPIGSRQSHLRD